LTRIQDSLSVVVSPAKCPSNRGRPGRNRISRRPLGAPELWAATRAGAGVGTLTVSSRVSQPLSLTFLLAPYDGVAQGERSERLASERMSSPISISGSTCPPQEVAIVLKEFSTARPPRLWTNATGCYPGGWRPILAWYSKRGRSEAMRHLGDGSDRGRPAWYGAPTGRWGALAILARKNLLHVLSVFEQAIPSVTSGVLKCQSDDAPLTAIRRGSLDGIFGGRYERHSSPVIEPRWERWPSDGFRQTAYQ
jgi:hypothetical protein